ncbi:hypothetical protein [Moorena producens]|uniref:hypothetical protein n=1 Tax=Moorena producens TaxID=1155739 RepID=UPI0011EA71C5|nr:hypothetical protein [Moorena producens]
MSSALMPICPPNKIRRSHSKSFVEWASCPFEIWPLRAGCPLYSYSLLGSATPKILLDFSFLLLMSVAIILKIRRFDYQWNSNREQVG